MLYIDAVCVIGLTFVCQYHPSTLCDDYNQLYYGILSREIIIFMFKGSVHQEIVFLFLSRCVWQSTLEFRFENGLTVLCFMA